MDYSTLDSVNPHSEPDVVNLHVRIPADVDYKLDMILKKLNKKKQPWLIEVINEVYHHLYESKQHGTDSN